MNVLVVDVGGTHVKILVSGESERRQFVSGTDLTAMSMVRQVKALAGDWNYDVVSIGYPGPIRDDQVAAEPHKLGTGLGSALIIDGVLEPMALGHLPYKRGTNEDYVGAHALKETGKKKWRKYVNGVIENFRAALGPDDILLGGGNAKHIATLPAGCRLGDNTDAFAGGFRLWRDDAIRE